MIYNKTKYMALIMVAMALLLCAAAYNDHKLVKKYNILVDMYKNCTGGVSYGQNSIVSDYSDWVNNLGWNVENKSNRTRAETTEGDT